MAVYGGVRDRNAALAYLALWNVLLRQQDFLTDYGNNEKRNEGRDDFESELNSFWNYADFKERTRAEKEATPQGNYTITFTQLSPDSDHIVSKNLDAISEVLFNNLKREGHLPDDAQAGKREVHETDKYDAFCSHAVYRAQISDGTKTIDVVLKFGDSPGEIKAYRFFGQFDDINTLTAVFNDNAVINGERTNVVGTEYLAGRNLTELTNGEHEGKFGKFKDAIRQGARIQHRGMQLELVDVVKNDETYFSKRAERTFLRKFAETSREWLSEEAQRRISELQYTIVGNYGVINSRLRQDSLENGGMYADLSPMNIRDADSGIHIMDLAGARKLTGWIALASLMEFGKKNVTDSDLISGDLEYLTDDQKTRLIDAYMLERAAEKADPETRARIKQFIDSTDDLYSENNKAIYHQFVSEEERQKGFLLFKYAAVQRHLEYTGYASRDIKNAPKDRRRLEFNRQRYHIRKAIGHLKDILMTDDSLDRQGMRELITLLHSLQEMSNIIEGQDIKRNTVHRFCANYLQEPSIQSSLYNRALAINMPGKVEKPYLKGLEDIVPYYKTEAA